MYSINKKVDDTMNSLVMFMNQRIDELTHDTDVHCLGLYMHDEKQICDVEIDDSTIMITFARAESRDGIIVDITTQITMRCISLYEIFVSTEMNADTTKELLDLLIRHEVGHVINFTSFLGHTEDMFTNYFRVNNEQRENMKKLRNNASFESRLKYFIEYQHLPSEENANTVAGLTDDDWINYLYKLAGRKRPKKLNI